MAASIFNPAQLPDKSDPQFGNKEIRLLANFYGREVEVDFKGSTFKSSPVLEVDQLIPEWPVFRWALQKEKEALISSKRLKKAPSFQEVFEAMLLSDAYSEIFPEVYNLVKILLALPVGTATVERSFSVMKMIKTRLRNRLSNENLTHLMRITIEGPDLKEVNFNEILDIFKEKNRRIRL